MQERNDPAAAPPDLPFVQTRGGGFVDEAGHPVTLRGCNLGNWLLLEMWMLGVKGVADQHEFESILASRFGERRKEELMELYRAGYITRRDFNLLRPFGFTCVRLPFHYSLIESDDAPMQLRPDAFRWLDRAVELARDAGLYIILDLHGTAGGQSIDHTTGRRGQNRLWTDVACQDRTVWLWKELAARYRESSTVAGYDLINEPFGDGETAAHLPALSALMDRLYREVRAIDKRHVIFIGGAKQGVDHYGTPAERGWDNVAFTEHYYPGLFGDDPSLETHARFLGQAIPVRAGRFAEMQVPLYVGEFNVATRRLGSPVLMRRYFDTYAQLGWAATMWSYKLLSRNGGTGGDFWGLVANRDPLPPLDPRASSYEDVRAWFAALATMPLVTDGELLRQLTAEKPDDLPLTTFPLLREAPHLDAVPGWQAADIGGARPGGQRRLGAHAVEIYGAGRDIWRNNDQFRFLSQASAGDVALSARLDRIDDTSRHAKAGLMFRAGTRADAAHAFIHAFPDGRVLAAWRERDGGAMSEREIGRGDFPIHLRIERRGGRLSASFSSDGIAWKPAAFPDGLALPDRVDAGLAVLAHAENQLLTTAAFADIALNP